MKIVKKILKIVLVIFLILVLIVAGYVGYVMITYNRIEDNLDLQVQNGSVSADLSLGTEYVAVTQNFGFGAYTRDFTFFMDGGKESRAKSKESVNECIEKAATEIKKHSPDFILMQEVDTDSTRSHHINQKTAFDEKFSGYSNAYAVNYHSAYLMWPLFNPHGKSNSGIVTYSKYDISSAMRRSLPISTSLSKFLDLDRCYSISKVPCENGKNLVIFNVHTSAYGGSDEIRTAQMTKLFNDMRDAYLNGDYVICGGDFNHEFYSGSQLAGGATFEWAQPFPDNLIPDGFGKATDYDGGIVNPTCRNCDVPYKEGNPAKILDGFIVSENITVNYVSNVSTGFEYSDHNPVVIKFTLN